VVREVESGVPGERCWVSAQGRLLIRELTPTVTLFIEEGHLDADFAPLVLAGLEATLRRPGRQHLFVDAERLTLYAPELQHAATAWIREHRARLVTQHMLVGSRLTQAGVSLASVNVGSAVRGYNVRERFEEALARAVGGEPEP
jgi:hypothetical protein